MADPHTEPTSARAHRLAQEVAQLRGELDAAHTAIGERDRRITQLLGRLPADQRRHITDAWAAPTATPRPVPAETLGEWVLPACGHLWRESRPAGVKLDPAQPRVCAQCPAGHPLSAGPSPQGMALMPVTYHHTKPDHRGRRD